MPLSEGLSGHSAILHLGSDGTCRVSRHPDVMGIGIIRANALAEPADDNTSNIETRDLIK